MRYAWKRAFTWAAVAAIIMLLIAAWFFPGKVKTAYYPVVKTIGGWIFYGETEGYDSLMWGDFIIKYPKGDRSVAEMVLNAIKKDADLVYNFFDYRPTKPVEVIIYANADNIHAALNISRNRTVEGAYYMGKIAILSPYEWPDAPKTNVEAYFEASSPVVHELTHMVVDDITRGNVPAWLTEGLATYMEYRILGYDWTSNINIDKPYDLNELTENFDALDEYKAYRQSFLMVKEMDERFGDGYLLGILNFLGRGENIYEVLVDGQGALANSLKR